MRPRRAIVPLALPFAVFCLWPVSLTAAEPEAVKVLDDTALHRLLVAELASALDGSKRLVPLPRNVSGVTIGPGGEPCFMVPAIQQTQQDALATAVARAARAEPGFRLLWGAQMLGRDGDRSFVMTTAADGTVAVIEGGGSRIVSLPQGGQPVQAVRFKKRWVFLTSAGIVMEGEAGAWEGSETFPASVGTRLLRSGDDGLVVLGMQPQVNVGQAMKRGVRAGDDWKIDTPALPGADFWRTAVRLADGRWLAIGQRIVELRGERPPRPTEQQMQMAIEAARAGDWPTLEPLLETISAYPSNETMGLSDQMRSLPDRGLPLRRASSLIDGTRRELARTQATEGLAPAQGARVAELLAACEEQLRLTAAALAEAVPDVFVRSPAAIAAMLRSGSQLYRGRWIKVMDVLRQESVDSALLHVRLDDDSGSGGTTAVAMLESDGTLRIIQELRGDAATGQFSKLHANDAGTAHVTIAGRGLARLSAAGTEWIETDGLPAGPLQVIGVDGRGRIFLRQEANMVGHHRASGEFASEGVLWLLDPNVAAAAPEPVVGWPLVGQPAVDADGSIWFLQPTVVASSVGPVGPKGGSQSGVVQSGVETRRIEPKSDPDAEQPSGIAVRPRDPSGAPQLCRLTSPTTLDEYGLSLPPTTANLIAGRGAVAIETQRGRGDDRVVIVGDTIRRGRDMHSLAETAFDAVLQAAPEAVLPDGRFGSMRPEGPNAAAQILRTKDLLWVNVGGRVEVYAGGKPLAVNDRLAMQNVPLTGRRLVGPLRTADGRPRVVLCSAGESVERFVWITAAERGLEIEKAGPLPPWPQTGGGDFATDVLPLVAGDRSAFYRHQRSGWVWQVRGPRDYQGLADAGTPILALPNGDGFLASRPPYRRSGVRVCTAVAREDVPVLFTRQLDPVAFCADGRLLCVGPGGLAWLAADPREGYVVEATRRLPHGFSPTGHVGRLGDAEVITALDRRQRPHLLVVRPAADREGS